MFYSAGKNEILLRGNDHGKIRGRGTGTGNGNGELGWVQTRGEMTTALRGNG